MGDSIPLLFHSHRRDGILLTWLTLNAAVNPFLAVFAGYPGLWPS